MNHFMKRFKIKNTNKKIEKLYKYNKKFYNEHEFRKKVFMVVMT